MGKVFDALEKAKIITNKEKTEGRNREPVIRDAAHNISGEPSQKSENIIEASKSIPKQDSINRQPKLQVNHNKPNQQPQKACFNPDNIDSNLITWFNPQSIESEQFRILKTNILFPENGKPPKTIMVTSAEPDEGKSFIAVNLSVSIAQSMDSHVLLIDGDIRNPSTHKMLGLKKTKGLREYLEKKETNLSNIIYDTVMDKLKFIPGGMPHKIPADLLSSNRMKQLIQETKERYDDRFIIIDLPPPQFTSEPNALARLVDGIILVINYGKTPRSTVKELIDNLGKEKIIGVVVNKIDPGILSKYGYSKYKLYGY